MSKIVWAFTLRNIYIKIDTETDKMRTEHNENLY